MPEKNLMESIRLAVGSRGDCRIFRNNVGVAHQGRVLSKTSGQVVLGGTRMIRFGLFPGSADLIGWKTITVTPDMVGQRIARFLSLECKSESGTSSREQETWIRAVRAAGGIAGVVRSVEDAEWLVG